VETFEAPRLRRVHPGPLRVEVGTATVVLRSLEVYPQGLALLWTCSPSTGSVARLAQGVPRVRVTLGEGRDPLGEATSGGGRTLFGTAFFAGGLDDGSAAVDVTLEVSGTTGADVAVVAQVAFPL
jgi:hypothetical protein